MEGTRRHQRGGHRLNSNASLFARIFSIFALALFSAGGCGQDVNPPPNPASPIIHVQILADCGQVDITASQPVTAYSAGSSDVKRLAIAPGQIAPIALDPHGWQVGNVSFAPGELHLVPAAPGSVAIAKVDKPTAPAAALDLRAYRGGYRLVPSGNGHFDVINDVDIDSYLKSVVSSEMPRTFLIEAFKAQAIAARTYALYEARTVGRTRGFDVFGDVRSQAYNGISAETDKSRQAVDTTSGIVLTVDAPGGPQLFKAYFSSCCGGITQSNVDAFGEEPIAPLVEQYVGPICAESPRYSWPEMDVRKDELTRRIRAWGIRHGQPEATMGPLQAIDIAATNRYGRPSRFFLTDARGYRYSVCSEDLRNACNTDIGTQPVLFSSFFKPVNEPDIVRFTEGHGWGHGVGMCQWTAEARAEQGMRHEQILALAYPQSRRVRAY
jgi:SpoIID/LytB domain protein